MRWIPLLVAVAVSCTTTTTPIATAPIHSPTAPAPAAATGPAAVPAATGAQSGEWGRIPDIPTPRSEVAAATFANTIFVIGGLGGPTAVERYVPISAAWRTEPALPVGVDHAMAAAIQAGAHFGVYVFGGNVAGAASARSFHLAPGATAWRELEPMPAPRAAGAAVAIGERIYVVGGALDARRLHLSVYEYHPDMDSWRIRADIPTARDHLAAAELGGKVCAVGGRRLQVTRNAGALECYDPVANAWEKLPDAPTARGGIGAAVVDGKLFVVGGERADGTFAEVEVYNPVARTWGRGPDLPTARHGLGVAAANGIVYALAGGPTPGASQTATCEALKARE